MALPEFKSALDFTTVRDFAYEKFHPLYYGAPIPEDPRDDPDDGELRQKFDLTDLEGDDDDYYGDEIYCKAMALFDFVPENENEIEVVEGQVIWVSLRHGQGWLLAENLETGETGLVPEEYVQLLPEGEDEDTASTDASEGDGADETDPDARAPNKASRANASPGTVPQSPTNRIPHEMESLRL